MQWLTSTLQFCENLLQVLQLLVKAGAELDSAHSQEAHMSLQRRDPAS